MGKTSGGPWALINVGGCRPGLLSMVRAQGAFGPRVAVLPVLREK